jgi:pilus assembly protein CpaE
MKDLIRIVLIDPNEESRNALQKLLRGIGSIWLSEVVNSFQDASARAGEIAAEVTIVVLDHDQNHALELIQKVAQTNAGTVVLPASRCAESGLILRSIRAGAREFLPLPAEQTEILDTISRLLRGRNESTASQTQGPRIISVTGATGGVGCTTVAVNLAAALGSNKEHETILLDLDLIFGGVDAYLDLPTDHTLSHIVQSFDRLDLTLLKRSITRHASGLYVLPHPTVIQEAAGIDPDVLRRLFGLLRAAFSTVVIDTSKGLQSADFSAFELSDVIVVVVQLDLLCLRNTARLLALFREYEGLIDRVKLVINRSDSWECQILPKKAEETLKMPINWSIPNAAKLFQEARLKGVPMGEIAKGSRPHQVFLEMAGSLRPAAAAAEAKSKPRRKFFAAFF